MHFATVDTRLDRLEDTLDGLENRRTPASDFLFELITKEIADAAVDPSEAEELFDRLEILISLEFAHLRIQKMATANIAHFWTPIGRYIWKRSGDAMFSRLTTFEHLSVDHPLFRAGLLGGTPETANNAVKEMREFIKQRPSIYF